MAKAGYVPSKKKNNRLKLKENFLKDCSMVEAHYGKFKMDKKFTIIVDLGRMGKNMVRGYRKA